MFPFYALWKHQKTIVFWYFRGVWKRNIEKKKIDLYIAVIVTAVHTHIGTCIIFLITGKTFCIELFARLRWCRSFSFSLAFLFFWLSYRKWCAKLFYPSDRIKTSCRKRSILIRTFQALRWNLEWSRKFRLSNLPQSIDLCPCKQVKLYAKV